MNPKQLFVSPLAGLLLGVFGRFLGVFGLLLGVLRPRAAAAAENFEHRPDKVKRQDGCQNPETHHNASGCALGHSGLDGQLGGRETKRHEQQK